MSHPFESLPRIVADIVAGAGVVASLAGWLPPIAALMGILWYCVLFYDRFVLQRVKR